MQMLSLEKRVDADHRARYAGQYVQSLNLSPLHDQIMAAGGQRRTASDRSQILFTLWLFANVNGVGSARHLARLTTRDLAYMWVCGGVSVSHIPQIRAAFASVVIRTAGKVRMGFAFVHRTADELA